MNELDYSCESLLEEISKWNTDDVVNLLTNNGLIESCAVIVKRHVDGKGLLSLTEQNLNSWKNDLAISSYRNLQRFVVQLKNNPEQYLTVRDSGSTSSAPLSTEIFSDSDTWDTDFDDDEDVVSISNHQRALKSLNKEDCSNGEEGEEVEEEKVEKVNRESAKMQFWQNKMRMRQQSLQAAPNVSRFEKPGAYLNRGNQQLSRREEEVQTEKEEEEDEEDEDENFYANGIELNQPSLSRVFSAGNKFESIGSSTNEETSLAELLKEKLRLRECTNNGNKPTPSPKSELVENHRKIDPQPPTNGELSQHSQLHAKTRPNNNRAVKIESAKPKVTAIRPELCQNKKPASKILKKPEQQPPRPPQQKIQSPVRSLPKPPSTSPLLTGKFNFLTDLPRSEKNSESIVRADGAQSLSGNPLLMSLIKSDYLSKSTATVDEDTYECINETSVLLQPTSNERYVQPIKPSSLKFPQLPPVKLPAVSPIKVGRQLLGGLGSRLADEVADMIVRIKRGLLRCCHARNSDSPEPTEPPELPERSPNGKSGVFSSPGSQARVTRPLPPPPDGQKVERPIDILSKKRDSQSFKDKPWFHNVNRDQAETLISGGGAEFGSSSHNGYFLLRPSGNSAEQPFTLVLWYRNRPFNIPVRKRHDSRFALGSAKPDEQSFSCVEEMVDFHKQKELVLHRNGVPVGNTRLTDTPPKRND